MAVRLRLARTGRKNRPCFRVAAFDSRTRRDGTPIEYLGNYDPYVKDFERAVTINVERAMHWISKGAKCSETVASFLKRKGCALPRNILKNGNRTRGKAAGAGKSGKSGAAAKSGTKADAPAAGGAAGRS